MTKGNNKLSLVAKLRDYLAKKDPKRAGTLGDRIIEKYYAMARAGDPIIMRDLINRIDGLPKGATTPEGNTVNINVLQQLFGSSIRPLQPTKEYKVLNVDSDK